MPRREEIPGQLGMFEVPPIYRRPKTPPKTDSWRAYKGKSVSCDQCVRDLHDGTPDGPLERARVVLTRVTGEVSLLCHRHGQAVKAPQTGVGRKGNQQ